MTNVYDIVGLIGSFIISAALVPQLTKVYRTKSANDISYPFVCMYITGLSLLAVYGFGEGLWPIYIPSTLELLGGISLLSMKLRYDKSPKYKQDKETGLVGDGSPKDFGPLTTPQQNV